MRKMQAVMNKEFTWDFADDVVTKNARVIQLTEVFMNKDLDELQTAIRLGLNINEWYNTHPVILKSTAEKHRMYTPKHLRNVHEEDRLQPLHLCAACHWTDGAAELIRAGAEINSYDYRVSPHLHYTDTSYTPLMHACCYAGVPLVKLLLDVGADPSAVDPASGSTPVSLAITYFCFPILQLLLDKGALFQRKDADSLPLQDAVEVFINPLLKITNAHQLTDVELKDKTEEVRGTALHLCKLLLENGSNPNTTQADTLPPLHLCAEGSRGDLRGMELLVSHGADVNLMTTGAYFHQYKHLTPLLMAVCTDQSVPTIQWLIQHGADVDQKYVRFYRGRTIGQPMSLLTIALEDGLVEVALEGDLVEVASMLIRTGCEVTAENVKSMQTIATDLRKMEQVKYEQTGQHVPQILVTIRCIEDILAFVQEPQDLKWQVRRALRRKFGVKGADTVQALPLPRPLKEFLMCYDL